MLGASKSEHYEFENEKEEDWGDKWGKIQIFKGETNFE